MKLYRGVRKPNGVSIFVDDVELLPDDSIKVRYYSQGFEFGYGGSGPSQLALAILLDLLGDPTLAMAYCQPFKQYFIECAPFEGFTLLETQIRDWLSNQDFTDLE